LFDPGVQRRLRFFEQRDLFEARGERRFDGQIARPRVEGGRHGEHHFLVGQVPVCRSRRAERFVQMIEQAKRGFDGRDLLDVLRRADRQIARTAIDAAIRKPALGARDHALRRFRTP
jgi:hypothetical protein